jgi:hypothetical protein
MLKPLTHFRRNVRELTPVHCGGSSHANCTEHERSDEWEQRDFAFTRAQVFPPQFPPNLSSPSGAPFQTRHWPFSDISCVSRANRPELIPYIRLQIRETALTAQNPQRWAGRFFLSALIVTRHAPTAPCRGWGRDGVYQRQPPAVLLLDDNHLFRWAIKTRSTCARSTVTATRP